MSSKGSSKERETKLIEMAGENKQLRTDRDGLKAKTIDMREGELRNLEELNELRSLVKLRDE